MNQSCKMNSENYVGNVDTGGKTIIQGSVNRTDYPSPVKMVPIQVVGGAEKKGDSGEPQNFQKPCDTQNPTEVMCSGKLRPDDSDGSIDDIVSSGKPLPASADALSTYELFQMYGTRMPPELKQELEAPPDHDRLYEQFQDEMKDADEDSLLSKYDPDTMRIVGDGGFALIVGAYRRDIVSGDKDDSIDSSRFPERIAFKLEYSSNVRPIEEIFNEQDLQHVASVRSPSAPGESGVAKVYTADKFSYRRPKHLEDRLRKSLESALDNIGVFNRGQTRKVVDTVLDYEIVRMPMDFVDGDSLDKYMHEHDLSLSEKHELMREITQAVWHFHEGGNFDKRGIVHCDLKPENIKVHEREMDGKTDRYVTILDFGIANYEGERLDPADVKGTPAYMSKKQLMPSDQSSERAVSKTWDVASLGIIAYEMHAGFNPRLTGASPDDSVADQVRRIMEEFPTIGDDKTTRALQDVIMKSVDPDGGYDNCLDFLADMDSAMEIYSSGFKDRDNFSQVPKERKASYSVDDGVGSEDFAKRAPAVVPVVPKGLSPQPISSKNSLFNNYSPGEGEDCPLATDVQAFAARMNNLGDENVPVDYIADLTSDLEREFGPFYDKLAESLGDSEDDS